MNEGIESEPVSGPSGGIQLPSSMQLLGACQPQPQRLGQVLLLRGVIPDLYVGDVPAYAVAFVQAGRSRYECRKGGVVRRSWAAPGGFNVSAGWGENAFRFESVLESVNVMVGLADLQSVVEREFEADGSRIALAEVDRCTRPEVISLGQQFAAMLRSPRLGSRLYVESLWNQLILQLIWNCSTLTPGRVWTPERLSDARIRRVVEFMEDSLGDQLSLEILAGVAGLSPNYFLSAFKRTTGQTPHQFLTERRIHRACTLLKDPTLTLTQIALRLGFSSQSHFTSVFRRVMHATPGVYRNQAFGLSGPDRL